MLKQKTAEEVQEGFALLQKAAADKAAAEEAAKKKKLRAKG